MSAPLLLSGAIGSPYTRKMKALMRYRRLPFRFIDWNSSEIEGLPKPPLPLLPCVYLPDGSGGYVAQSDSTFQIRTLEEREGERSVIPADPALAFLDYLIEDYADEWLTKPMFFYRWGIEENVDHASNMLPMWNLTVPDESVEQFRTTFAQRQIDRLSGIVTGSLEVCGPIIEASYHRLLAILREHFVSNRFVLGNRPGAGDFGLVGQLTQLVQVEPTPQAICRAEAPRVMAWVDVAEDLSGLAIDGDQGWVDRDALSETFRELLGEIGRTYAPFMLANEKALAAGDEDMECTLDGQRYWQRAFAYQGKCLKWLRAEYQSLAADDRSFVDKTLTGTGCESLLASGPA